MREGWILCQEVMVQVLQVRGPALDAAWDGARARAEAGWADRLQRDRAETVCVRNAGPRLVMLPDSHAMR